jgi:hypothetical protein
MVPRWFALLPPSLPDRQPEWLTGHHQSRDMRSAWGTERSKSPALGTLAGQAGMANGWLLPPEPVDSWRVLLAVGGSAALVSTTLALAQGWVTCRLATTGDGGAGFSLFDETPLLGRSVTLLASTTALASTCAWLPHALFRDPNTRRYRLEHLVDPCNDAAIEDPSCVARSTDGGWGLISPIPGSVPPLPRQAETPTQRLDALRRRAEVPEYLRHRSSRDA